MDLNKHKPQFEKVVGHFKNEVAGIRTGRASSALVEDLTVEHYGGKYRLKELASITVPEPKTILVQPWDKGVLDAISRAIANSSLGLNPISDVQGLRLVLPALTEDRRREFIKLLKQKAEEAHMAIRHIRGEIWDDVQEQEKAGAIRENDKFKAKDNLQKIVDEHNQRIEEIERKKEQELLT